MSVEINGEQFRTFSDYMNDEAKVPPPKKIVSNSRRNSLANSSKHAKKKVCHSEVLQSSAA